MVPPDPFKHVNYTLGMVLGVTDLTQDFVYGRERDAAIIRDLIGYGTVCGLAVSADELGPEPQVLVGLGTAVSPRGQFIHVPCAQSARLNDWLAAHATRVAQYRSGDNLRLYVVVRYRECLTDAVPIPGEPCRSEDEMMAPSRVQDDYQLDMLFVPPDQRHDDAIRDFWAWLSQIERADVPDSPALLAAFEDAVRQAVPQLSSPPTSPPTSPPDYMIGSPPDSVVIPRVAACDYLRLAFLIWTTELRPLWLGINQTCAGEPPDEEYVLLAELDIGLTAAGQVADAPAIAVNERERPFLVSLRMLQEAMLCGLGGGSAADAGDTVVAETAFGQASNAGGAPELSRADHTHGTPPDPIPPHQADPAAHTLIGDVTGPVSATVVASLRGAALDGAAPGEAQVLTFQGGAWRPADHPHVAPLDPIPPHQADPAAHTLIGDVTGPVSATVVARIAGAPVNQTAPAPAQVLTFTGGEARWAAPAAAGGEFVEHPPGLPRYAIVAAGEVLGDGTAVGPTYNGLTAQVNGDPGVVEFRFDDYVFDNAAKYIVKALLVFNRALFDQQTISMPVVRFGSFEADHFRLIVAVSPLVILSDNAGSPILNQETGDVVRVTAAPAPADPPLLERMAFMIEVSRFEAV